jgi:hypothetical protein
MSEHVNRLKASAGDSSFGSFAKTLQVLFDESITDANVVHETWSHAWGRAISYAWQSEENKKRLLENPTEVLAQFNYALPAGVKLLVVEANKEETININKESGSLAYNPDNLLSYRAYLVDVDSIKNTEEKASNGSDQVKFKLQDINNDDYFANTLKSDISPVNGWIDLPDEGVIAKHPSGRFWWVTKKDFFIKSWPTGEIFNAPMLDQFIDSEPDFLQLASTIIMTLPPKPGVENQTIALTDYDALGKIYPFSS